MIRIQVEDFSVEEELRALRAESRAIGAIVSFLGLVRDINEDGAVSELFLEHYPGMTEKSIAEIVDEASGRWELAAVRVIHRVGRLVPQDQIVLVACASRHRQDAFAGAEFIMDYLKTRAPFWKKETTPEGGRWLDTRAADVAKAREWDAGTPASKRVSKR